MENVVNVEEKVVVKASDLREALKSEVTIIVKPETVKKLLELADDLIKTYGEERALIVFYIRQVNENEGRYRIDTLNSTLEDEIEKVNRIYSELILNS
ncbi:MAG: hypothetical protein JHC31_08200 [Sulfurihydrogenibium sp.]|nr:hypothetical protein [Sulfurihydrogenibium sp.]